MKRKSSESTDETKRPKPDEMIVPRIIAAGRGRVVQMAPIRSELFRLVGKEPSKINLLYLGTATYEDDESFRVQTAGFVEEGVNIERLNLTDNFGSTKEGRRRLICHWADAVLVSGGNTLFAVNRWRRQGVDRLLKEAANRGVVLAGGSAGAICWFKAGHSDSRDPTTLRNPRKDLTEEQKRNWSYIRVSGIDVVPLMCCPHYDSTQSNGVARADDFAGMMTKICSNDIGLCIEDQAAIIIEGDSYRVVSAGARLTDATQPAGCHRAYVQEGVVATNAITTGKIADLWNIE